MLLISLFIWFTRSAITVFSPAPFTIVVFSLPTVAFSQVPNISIVACSNLSPFSSLITVAPVNTAISSNIALRRSPNPGAFTAHIFKPARKRLTTKVVSASLSTSSAITSKERPLSATGCKIGRKSLILLIFLS